VAAIPVPDEIGGEVVGVLVVTKRGRKIAADQIKQFCRQHLEPYKVPRQVWLVESLPKTDNGKIDYKKLINSLKTLEKVPKQDKKRQLPLEVVGRIVEDLKDLMTIR
jgi:acyl-coenzyme A synthetase/AMP-(fatty) acid ligase